MNINRVIGSFVLLAIAACDRPMDALVPSHVDTTIFDGQYRLIAESSFLPLMEDLSKAKDEETRKKIEAILTDQVDQYSDFSIHNGVIRSGRLLVQEFSITTARLEGNTLRGSAIWHEDVHDPGDCAEEPIFLRIRDDILEFAIGDTQDELAHPVVLRRISTVHSDD